MPSAKLSKSFVEFDFPAIGQLIKLSKDDFNDFFRVRFWYSLT